MRSFSPEDMPVQALQQLMQTAIAPRPICFASTISAAGEVNLSPFSFFNMFSTNPPICIFSPARRVRDNTVKHTLENVQEVPEVVINVVTEPMVQQASLASTEYARGIDEFEKAGFTALPSQTIRPPRVAESPVQFECVVNQVIALGTGPGAGNLVVAEVKRIHVAENVLDKNGNLDQQLLPLVARLGGDWYCAVNESNLFRVAKPLTTLGIGVDALPAAIRNSSVLTGNHLGMLANVEQMPVAAGTGETFSTTGISSQSETERHKQAKTLLEEGKVQEAWQVLLQPYQ